MMFRTPPASSRGFEQKARLQTVQVALLQLHKIICVIRVRQRIHRSDDRSVLEGLIDRCCCRVATEIHTFKIRKGLPSEHTPHELRKNNISFARHHRIDESKLTDHFNAHYSFAVCTSEDYENIRATFLDAS